MQVCIINARTGGTLVTLDFSGPPVGMAFASSAGEEESAADPVLEHMLSVNVNHATLMVCRVSHLDRCDTQVVSSLEPSAT